MADHENCTLPAYANDCSKAACAICGWDKGVNQARSQEIEAGGLTLCSDGKRRLIIKKKTEVEA